MVHIIRMMLTLIVIVCGVHAGLRPLAAAASADFVRAEGRRLIDSHGQQLVIRGVMLEGWIHGQPLVWGSGVFASESGVLERIADLLGPEAVADFRERLIASWTTAEDIRRIAELGFNTVRVPVNHIALDTYEDGWTALDQVIDWCEGHDLYVIIDLHAAPSPQNNSTLIADYRFPEPLLFDRGGNRAETVELWRRIARRYRDETTVLGYDLLNEPNVAAAADPVTDLIDVYRELTAAVRAEDPHHLLIYEGDDYAKDLSIFTERLDDNAALQFHTYNWFGENLHDQLAVFDAKGAELGMPIFNGEFGGHRTSWVAGTRQAFESEAYQFSGWVFWNWKSVHRTGGDWLGIPYDEIRYVREFTIGERWRSVIAWLGQEPFAAKPDPETVRAALDDFFAAITLAQTVEHRPTVEALFDFTRTIELRVTPAVQGLTITVDDDRTEVADGPSGARFDHLARDLDHRFTFSQAPIANQ